MRTWLKVVGGFAIVAVSFITTNYILELRNTPERRDAQRVEDIKKLREAVRSYRRARNTFPTDLKLLVDSRFLDSMPVDPATQKQYQYYSDGVNNFGLMVSLEQRHGDVAAGQSCRTGLGTKQSAMWGHDIAECPF